MKSHRNLWDQFISKENFAFAVKRALRHKKKTAEIRRFLENADEMTERLRMAVLGGQFTTSKYRVKTIYEPKKREIYILPFYPDRIVHHALMNVLIPIWDRMFIDDSFACRPKKGIHSASQRCMRFVRRNKYVLQCDVRKFYPSIDHRVLMDIISHKIKDKKLVGLIENIVGSVEGDTNLPIGNFCSQWFGNLYLHELDLFVKHELRARDYLRYCDDFCLFSDSKRELGRHLAKIRSFLADKLRLTFSLAEISTVGNGVDFLGYRHFPDCVRMRKSTFERITRRLGRILAVPAALRAADNRIMGQIGSMHGWLKHARNDFGDVRVMLLG
ncbi:MAG: reverse transcriptase/maturase family protein [Rickettsiales bacterium]|jgi:hypothetical protein|nr:reverse transcriptase/maturase family protein [Rickettsiales bacterium]